jgi:hypothetical protein
LNCRSWGYQKWGRSSEQIIASLITLLLTLLSDYSI